MIKKIKERAKISPEKISKNTEPPVILGVQLYQYCCTDLCNHIYVDTNARFLKACGSIEVYPSKY